MIPKLEPSPEAVEFACQLASVNPRVFDRTSGVRRNTYCRLPDLVRCRRRVWAIIRAVWCWSYPEIAYQTGSPNHSTVIDALQDEGLFDEIVMTAVREWAHATYDALGENAPRLPDMRLWAMPAEPMPEAAPVTIPVQVPRAERVAKSAPMPRQVAVWHGYSCGCSLCSTLRDTADRMARRPNITVNMLEPVVRPFFREAKKRMECKA